MYFIVHVGKIIKMFLFVMNIQNNLVFIDEKTKFPQTVLSFL